MELNRGSVELSRSRRVNQDDYSDEESCDINIANQQQEDIEQWRNIEIELQEAELGQIKESWKV